MDITIKGRGNDIKSIVTINNYDKDFPRYCSRQLGACYKYIDNNNFSIVGENNYETMITLLYEFGKIR